MSIKTVSGSNIAPRDIPAPVFPLVPDATPATAWVRPSDWLTLPTITSTDQKFAGLLAITNDNTNYIAFTATTSAGTYTVDWGDGSATQTFASGATASKVFDYASISAGTTTTQGFRQTIITVTPTTNNLTGINLQVKYTNVPALGAYTSKWIDINVGSPNMTSMTVGAATPTVNMGWLQQFQLQSTGTTFSTLIFYNCYALQSIPTLNFSRITLNTYNGTTFFQNCYQLAIAPSAIDYSKFNNMTNFFYNCNRLQSVPYLNSTNNTTCSNMFYQCYLLRSIGGLDMSKVTTTINMFAACTSLISTPLLNTSTLLITTTQMFDGCWALNAVSLFNVINVTNAQLMFRNCYTLTSVPPFNFANATTVDQMFISCTNLRSVTNLNLPKATSLYLMFNSTPNLQNVAITTSNLLTNTVSMFQNSNVRNVLTFDTSGVTNAVSMFSGCYALTTAPNLNLSNVSNANTMFSGCTNLKTVPAYTTSNLTIAGYMFYQANSLQTVPLFDTSKVTFISGMFQQARSLTSVPAFNFSNVITADSTFYGCNSLPTISSSIALPKATSMGLFFNSCTGLTSIPTAFANSLGNCLNMQLMFSNCSSLTSVPDITTSPSLSVGPSFSNCVSLSRIGNFNANNTTTAFGFDNCPTLSTINFSNIKGTMSLTSTLIGKVAMENIFANLQNNQAQTITITSTPAASAAVSLAGTWGNASNIITMTNTTGLIVGMTVTGANISGNIAITTYANGKISANNFAAANNMIRLYANTGGLIANTPYYVSNASGTSPTYYDVSNVAGGTPLTLTAAGPANGQFDVKIATINTNANIIITAWPNGNATTTTFSSRNLNTNLATFKNWTLTG